MHSSFARFAQLIIVGFFHLGDAIFQGSPAKLGEFPAVVALSVRNVVFCTGSILDRKHIITAAHCIHGIAVANRIEVAAGVVNWADKSEASVSRVETIHVHPNYIKNNPLKPSLPWKLYHAIFSRGSVYKDDIAILTLKKALKMKKGKIEALPRAKDRDSYIGKTCKLVGWGGINWEDDWDGILHQTEVTIWSRAKCLLVTRFYTCGALYACNSRQCLTALPGDSGGPLICDGFLVAILTSVPTVPIKFIRNMFPDTYESVHYHQKFIDDVISAGLLETNESPDCKKIYRL